MTKIFKFWATQMLKKNHGWDNFVTFGKYMLCRPCLFNYLVYHKKILSTRNPQLKCLIISASLCIENQAKHAGLLFMTSRPGESIFTYPDVPYPKHVQSDTHFLLIFVSKAEKSNKS